MAFWSAAAPAYSPPGVSSPNWVWSIVGRGNNTINNTKVVIIRLDYVQLDSSGSFVRVNNFRPGWASGGCTRYMPLFMHLNEGTVGTSGGSHIAGYDYWASQGANVFWQNYVWKFLYGMKQTATMAAYFPLAGTP